MDTVSTTIAAPPQHVYALVADVTDMGRWSPECYRCEWLDGATEATAGARFKGWNLQRVGPLPVRWKTVCTVNTAVAGEELSFTTKQSAATWTYRFAPDGNGGTELTEIREDGDKPALARIFAAVMPRRDELLRDGMRQSIERIKAAAEAG